MIENEKEENKNKDNDSFPPVSRTNMPEAIGAQIGPYKTLSVLGEGGFGIVYLAEQKKPVRRQVALKVIKPGMDSKQIIARFEAEEQALALLDHPNIAHIFDAGTTEVGRPYFAMEHVKGTSITEHCDHHKFTIEERLHLFLKVCEAVQHAHQKGIIHRDIKPSNILMSVRGEKAIPMIIDFGVAKALSQPLTERTLFTRQGQLIGTPEYMSPEQAGMATHDIDTRSDIYSLGVLLYELLTGVLPFDPQILREGGINRIQHMICEEDPKTPSTRLSTVSSEKITILAQQRHTDVRSLKSELRGDLDWITMKAMEKDRNRRYETPHALIEDIHNHLNHEPVRAAPPSVSYRVKKFVLKHRTPLVISASILVVAILSLLALNMYIRVKTTEQQLIEEQQARYEEERQEQAHSALSEAEKFRSKGQYSQALEKLKSPLMSDTLKHEASLLSARLLFESNQSDDAIAELEKLINEPGKPLEITCAAHYLLAEIYLENDLTKSKEHKTEGDKLDKLLPTKSVEYYFLQGLTAATPDDTIRWLNMAIDSDPMHYESRKTRALAQWEVSDYIGMAQDAEVMIAIRKNNWLGYSYRASARHNMGEFESAIRDYDRAIALNASEGNSQRDPELYHLRFLCLMATGDYEKALIDANTCLDLQPDDRQYKFNIFCSLAALGRLEEANAQYKSLVRDVSTMKSDLWKKAKFRRWSEKYVFDVLSSGQELDLPKSSLYEDALWPMRDAAIYYRDLAIKARYEVTEGFKATWSPDGAKLAYTRVFPLADGSIDTSLNGIEILDLESGRIQLLVVTGKDPVWSPDGKYIAFVREKSKGQQGQSRDDISSDEELPWGIITGAFGYDLDEVPFSSLNGDIQKDEIWIIEPNGEGLRFLTKGGFPSWSKNPKHLYYRSRLDKYLYRISVEETVPEPERVVYSPGSYYPVISPDEKYVAYGYKYKSGRCRLHIKELSDPNSLFATWEVPRYEQGLLVQWSPDGRELSIGGFNVSDLGLWIYDLQTRKASKVINGAATMGIWSPDKRRFAFDLREPFWEIWTADLDPNVPTIQALSPSQSLDDHYRYLVSKYTQAIQAKALDTYNRKFIDKLIINLARKGVEQYNKKAYKDALWAFTDVNRLGRALYKEFDPIYVLHYTTLILYKLGRIEQAEAVLEKLREKFKDGRKSDYFLYLIRTEKLIFEEDSKVFNIWDRIEKSELEKASELLVELKIELPDDDPYINQRVRSIETHLAVAYVHRSRSNNSKREYMRATSDLESAFKIDPNLALAYNGIAWLQATCPETQFRNGTLAVENATKASKLTSWKNGWYLDTLAAAYAESGDFAKAVEWQKVAIQNLPENLRAGMREGYEARLKLYEQHEPYHQQYLWPNQLIVHYTFDKIDSNRIVDSSSHGINGTLQGDAQIIEDPLRGKVLKLDGDGDWVDCGNDVRFDIQDKITVSIWIRIAEFNKGWQGIATKGNGAWRLQRYRNTNFIEFSCSGLDVEGQMAGTGYLFGNVNVNDSRWHHLVGVYDGTRTTLYVDGKQDVSSKASGKIYTTSIKFLIGAHENESDPGEWNGLIDDVRIYSYALSEAEVKELYEGHGSGS